MHTHTYTHSMFLYVILHRNFSVFLIERRIHPSNQCPNCWSHRDVAMRLVILIPSSIGIWQARNNGMSWG